jgi:hypothetical protein
MESEQKRWPKKSALLSLSRVMPATLGELRPRVALLFSLEKLVLTVLVLVKVVVVAVRAEVVARGDGSDDEGPGPAWV